MGLLPRSDCRVVCCPGLRRMSEPCSELGAREPAILGLHSLTPCSPLSLCPPPTCPDGGEGGHGQAAAEARVPAGTWAALWAAGAGHAQAAGPRAVHPAASGLAACTPTPTLLRAPWAGPDSSGRGRAHLPLQPTATHPVPILFLWGTLHTGSQRALCHPCLLHPPQSSLSAANSTALPGLVPV